MSQSPHNTRGRKGSLKDSVKDSNPSDFTAMLVALEDRLKAFIKSEVASLASQVTSLTTKVDNIEQKLSSVQTDCLRLDNEIQTIRRVITDQQLTIESHEQKLRANNIIIHNIPEDVVLLNGDQIKNDTEKIMSLCKLADIEIVREDLVSVSRLGKRLPDGVRPLKLILNQPNKKYKFFNARKAVISNPLIKQTFKSNIYVNADSSPLMRKEEYRLRHKLRDIKLSNPTSAVFIRSGALHLDGAVVDRLDVRNQMG